TEYSVQSWTLDTRHVAASVISRSTPAYRGEHIWPQNGPKEAYTGDPERLSIPIARVINAYQIPDSIATNFSSSQLQILADLATLITSSFWACSVAFIRVSSLCG